MYHPNMASRSGAYLKDLRRRKANRGDASQEMEPLAAQEEYGDTTPNYGGTSQESPDLGSAPMAGQDPDTHEGANDATDFSANRILQSGNKIRRPSRPTLKISASTQSPTLGSPDSDTDVLGYLDYTPDPLADNSDGRGSNSYSKLYHCTKYLELMPEVFVSGLPVHLQIARVQPVYSHIHLFNNHMLIIDLEHGDHRWTVQKKVRQVASLHRILLLFRTRIKMPAATRVTRQRRQSMRQQIKAADESVDVVDGESHTVTSRQLKFPRRALQTMDESVRVELEIYLRNVLHHPLFRSHQAVLEFFEISPVSFIGDLGIKAKEGYVKKRIGGSSPSECCNWMATACSGKYKQRWLVLKETCLFFLVPETGLVRTVMLMDAGFQVSHSYRLIGARNGLLISNLSRSLMIKCDSESTKKEWFSLISKTQRKYAKEFTSQDTRYGSFAPVRRNSYARWYVDGARYMWDVADVLEAAREEIFITDWWMSPQIYLKRPDLTGQQWRLAEVLRRKAEDGVRVFIMLYKEVELALGISSLLTKRTVNQLHPNIKVLRHPDHMAGGVLYWAHHEKVVVVDQMFAFVGGIDLAFGRWDDYRHKLVDVGHAGVQQAQQQPTSPRHTGSSPGALHHLVRGTHEVLVGTVGHSTSSSRRTSLDASNPEETNTTLSTSISSLALNQPVKQSSEEQTEAVDQPPDGHSVHWDAEMQQLSKNEQPGVENIQNGKSVHQEAVPLQSVDRKAHTKGSRFFSRDGKEGRDRANTGSGTSSTEDESREKKMGGFQEVKKMGIDLMEEMREKGREMKAWTGRKLPALHRRSSVDSEMSEDSSDDGDKMESLRNSFYKLHKHKMKFKDRVGSCSSLAQAHSVVTMEDTTSTHLWVGKDYVNWISKDLDNLDEPFKDIVDRRQTPRMPWHDIGLFVEGAAARDVARHFIQRWNAVKTEKLKPNHNYPYLLPRTYSRDSFVPGNLQPRHMVKCQVVRSVGKWSAGLDETEASIFSAYVDLIRNARHYIYIENQFFITSGNVHDQKEVTNYIGYEIVQRILKAHSKGEVFRVYILLPLLPAFEGMIGKSSGVAMQYIVYWNYVSISRGRSSVIQCLKDQGISEWEQYVTFCSLRNHEMLGERPVSELIYIHSKLMIVDDRFVIAGSANINDRSLNGFRDSEVCLVIEDQEFESSVMNGQPYDAGVFAGSMRRYLFSEHLGQADKETPSLDMSDPVSDAFFISVWSYIANKNTLIFEEVFSCYPCNSATTFEAVDKLRNTATMADVNPVDAQAKLKEVQGHLVQFPLDFLKDETLKPGVGNKEYLLPMETWT